MKKVGVGLLGCGNISDIYLQNLTGRFDGVYVAAIGSRSPARARAQAVKYGVAKCLTTDELLRDPEVEIVLNITPPTVHEALNRRCLEAGKHVYSEKPVALTGREAQALLALAREKGLLLCAAPDTFLGAGYQTARALIDSGEIGEIVSAATFDLCPGHERWHPAPAFFYQHGAGPMFDRGPYNLTALVSLIGPADGLFGMTGQAFDQRVVTSQPLTGQTIDVEVPTHVCGLIHFVNGCLCTIIESFDAPGTVLPNMELQGTKATLLLPDPNTFGGEIRLLPRGEKAFHTVPLTRPYAENSRGLGVADMARCLREGGTPRTDGALAAHVTEIMEKLHTSWDEKRYLPLESACERPAPLPESGL